MELVTFKTDIGNSYLEDSIKYYIEHGTDPGGFLTAVFNNNLFGAIQKADHFNKQEISTIVLWVFDNLPKISYGNQELVQNWQQDTDKIRTRYIEKLKKQRTWEILQQ